MFIDNILDRLTALFAICEEHPSTVLSGAVGVHMGNEPAKLCSTRL
jgi:hypothetical protein